MQFSFCLQTYGVVSFVIFRQVVIVIIYLRAFVADF